MHHWTFVLRFFKYVLPRSGSELSVAVAAERISNTCVLILVRPSKTCWQYQLLEDISIFSAQYQTPIVLLDIWLGLYISLYLFGYRTVYRYTKRILNSLIILIMSAWLQLLPKPITITGYNVIVFLLRIYYLLWLPSLLPSTECRILEYLMSFGLTSINNYLSRCLLLVTDPTIHMLLYSLTQSYPYYIWLFIPDWSDLVLRLIIKRAYMVSFNPILYMIFSFLLRLTWFPKIRWVLSHSAFQN